MLFTSISGAIVGVSRANISTLTFLKQQSCLLQRGFTLNKEAFSWNLIHYKYLCTSADEPRNGPDQILPASSRKAWVAKEPVQLLRSETGHNAQEPFSVHTLLKRQAKTWATHRALAVKREGEWKYWTFADYYEESRIVSKAFIKLGLDRFHGVAIMGANSPEWVLSSLGCIMAGGLSAGVYVTNSPEACRHLADDCKAQIIVVENEEYLEKFLSVKDSLPHIKAIIQWSGSPPEGSSDVWSWSDLMAIGRAEDDEGLEERLSLQAVNQCATLVYTSGTTGPPKGVMCSQDNLTWGGAQMNTYMFVTPGVEILVSYLPFSHTAGYILDVFLGITSAATLYFAPPDALKGGTLLSTFQEVRPTSLLAVPRVYEKVAESMKEAASKNTGVKRAVGNWAKKHASNYHNAFRDGRKLSAFQQVNYYLAKVLLLNRIKQVIGFDRSTRFVTGAAPISPAVVDYLTSLDMPIMEGFAMAETMAMGAICQPLPHRFKTGSVGKPLYLNEICLGNKGDLLEGEGEVLVRGRNVCMGYHGLEDETNKALDSDSWLHTGDIGRFDSDGFMFITGRIKELVITAGGENVPPVLIEDTIKREIPIIASAMLIGDHQKYLSLLIAVKSEIDTEGHPLSPLTDVCLRHLKNIGSEATTVEEVLKEVQDQPEGAIVTYINEGIDRYNTHSAASNAQKIQRWTLLPHDFSIPTGELNSTLKLKRKVAVEKYKHLIDSMYDQTN